MKKEIAKKPDQPSKASLIRHVQVITFYLLVLFIAAYAIFVLPYSYPSSEITNSVSYAMGFNNRVAVIACLAVIAIFSLKMLAGRRPAENASLMFSATGQVDRVTHMGMTAFWTMVVIYATVTLLLYWTVPFIGGYGEARYFFRRFEIILNYDLSPYRQLEFAYGPALVYLPIAMFRIGQLLGVSMQFVYLLIYLGLTIFGLWLLFYVVDNFQCKTRYRVVIFVLLSMCFINLALGLQYTPVRYVIPFAAILWLNNAISRQSSLLATPAKVGLIGFLLPAAVLSISPEMGVAYLVAQTLFFLISAYKLNRRLAWGALDGLLVLPVFLLLFSWDFFASLFTFSKGGNNFPVVPAAHIVLYLAGLFYALPIVIAEILRKGNASAKPVLAAMVALIVLMIPSALGRCDPGHVYSSGVSLFILTFALLAEYRPRIFTVYVILFVLSAIVIANITGIYLYRYQLESVKSVLCDKSTAQEPNGAPSPMATIGDYGPMMIPLVLDWNSEHYLRVNRRIIPEYYPDLINVFEPSVCNRKLKDLEKAKVVFVPDWVPNFKNYSATADLDPKYVKGHEKDENESVSMLFMYPINYKTKYRRYNAYFDVGSYLAKHFRTVMTGDGYAIMVRESP